MRIRAIIYVSMLLLWALQAHAQSFDIIKTTPKEDRISKAYGIFADKYWRADSVSAFRQLSQLDNIAIKLQDTSLELAIYQFKAEYYSAYNGFRFNRQSLYYYDKAIDQASDYGLTVESGRYIFEKALYYYYLKMYVPAFQNFLKGYDIFKSAGFNNVPGIVKYMINIAVFYYNLGDFETARHFMLEALSVKPTGRDEINVINTIGLTYRSTNDYDNALLYLKKALNLAKKYKDSAWVGIATGNIGSVYFMQGKYDLSLPYMKTDYEQSLKYGLPNNAGIALIRIAAVNTEKNNFAEASRQLSTAEKLLISDAIDNLIHRIDIYALRAKIYKKTGQLLAALAYQEKYIAANDTLTRQKDVLSVERIKLKYEMDKDQLKVNQLNAKARAEAIMRNGLAGILLLLMIITFLLYNRQKLIRKKDQAALQLETARADQERDKARLALIDYTEKLRQHTDLIENFKAELEDMHGRADPSYQQRLTQLQDMLQAHIMTDRAWLEFKTLFDNVHARFFANISSRFKNLSETDLRHLALIKLRLSNREMANMLGVTIEGIKKAKQRLRKKIGLPDENNLEEAIAGI